MTIRHATPDDVPRLVDMSRHFLASTAYGRLLIPTTEQLEAFVVLILTHGGALVAEVDGQVEGMIGVVALAHPITQELVAEEVAWWVEPDYRKGTIGPRLLQAAEDWASVKGVTVLKMVAPAKSDVGKYYERHGYTAFETAFVKVLM